MLIETASMYNLYDQDCLCTICNFDKVLLLYLSIVSMVRLLCT